MALKTAVRTRNPKIFGLLAATVLLFAHCRAAGGGVQANPQPQVERPSASSVLLAIQGRITTMQDDLVTVKTPDGYPGGPGVHAQFVTAGPTFRVDVSRARILLPDGTRADRVPLAVGDRVLMVLSGPESGSPAPNGPRNENQVYSASVIERIVQSDRITTH